MGVPLERMVLDGPYPVETHLLGEDRLFHAAPQDLALVLGRWMGHLSLEDH
jgi:hypothetical protein